MIAALLAAGMAGVRWLRVAQREHYLAGSASTFARRWWTLGANRLLLVAVVLSIVIVASAPLAGLPGAAAIATGPFGLAVRGRTSKLAWTRRLRTLAVIWVVLQLAIVAAGVLAGAGPLIALVAAALTPLVVDGALAVATPIERRLAQPWVKRAEQRLAQVRPRVVGITGSYGKTTTKGYVAHLAGATATVVATPASFNNLAGLARSINEQLIPGTEVFVAEMGTYGPGEIAELCRLCPPAIAVICALGPVHLERMGSEEAILAAKAEILAGAEVAVLNLDHPLVAALAAERTASGQRVVGCSTVDAGAGVSVVDATLRVGGREIGTIERIDIHPANLACAVAVAVELGVPEATLLEHVATLPNPPHRLTTQAAGSGATVLDDTYNANPAGGTAALAALVRQGRDAARRVVVTPGMVELGSRQSDENRRFAAAASSGPATHLVVVGHTNRAALRAGAGEGDAEVVLVDTREQAVAWVRQHVGEGDVVLYENDLPDHFA